MNSSLINESVEYIVLKQFQRALLRYGRSIELSSNTDVTKTYGWRYLQAFVNNIQKLEVVDNIPFIVDTLVEHAHKHKLLHRGFAILSKVNLIELIINASQKDINNKQERLYDIERAMKFLSSQSSQSNIKLDDVLNRRMRIGTYTNLTKWFEQGHINKEYIALSKACVNVMQKMDFMERRVLPSPIELLKIKHKLLADKEFVDKIVTLMGDDFNPLWQ